MFWKRKRVGLALGGGGARGLAHIGVIRVLEEERIPIDLIVGSSIGSLVGGAYASGTRPDVMEEKVETYLQSPAFRSSAMKAFERAHQKGELPLPKRVEAQFRHWSYLIQAMFKPGILPQEEFEKTIHYFIPDIQIEETRIPFRAVATDLKSGTLITFSHGSLRQAVMASCSVPGAFPPLRDGERLLSDGGIVCLVPTSVAREEGADRVISVAVDRYSSGEELRNVVDIYYRICEIMGERLRQYELEDADVVIHPRVGDSHWSNFSQARHLIDEGERATREKLGEIRQKILRGKTWFRLKKRANQTQR